MSFLFQCPKKGARRLKRQRLSQSSCDLGNLPKPTKHADDIPIVFYVAAIMEDALELARRKRVNQQPSKSSSRVA